MIIPFSERLKRMEVERNRLLLSFRSQDLDSILQHCEILEKQKIYLDESKLDFIYHFISHNDCDNVESIIIISHLINLKASVTLNAKNLFLKRYCVDNKFNGDNIKEVAERLFSNKRSLYNE